MCRSDLSNEHKQYNPEENGCSGAEPSDMPRRSFMK